MTALLMVLVSLVWWPLRTAVAAILFLLGLIIVPVLAYTGRYEFEHVPRYNRQLVTWDYRWAWLWGNDEDGVDGRRGFDKSNDWWLEKTIDDSWATRIVKWSALRNPVSNDRFVLPFIIDPKKVRWIGNTRYIDQRSKVRPQDFLWHFCWHGWYTGMWVAYHGYMIRLGYKVHPEDQCGLADNDYRRQGVPFAFQCGRV